MSGVFDPLLDPRAWFDPLLIPEAWFDPDLTLAAASPSVAEPVLLQATVINLGPKTNEGRLVESVSLPWFEIMKELRRDPAFLHRIHWHTMEQLIAGAYERAEWDVVLTPRGKNDGGRDVIATRRDFGSICFFDQVKTFRPGRTVKPADVDAMLGVLSQTPNVSKGIVSTTADFAPSILVNPAVTKFMPNRLELRNGPELHKWLVNIASAANPTATP